MFSNISPIKTIALSLATSLLLSGAASATTYHHWNQNTQSQQSKFHSNCCVIDENDFTNVSTSGTSGTDLTGKSLKIDHATDHGSGMTVHKSVTTEVGNPVEANFYDVISLDFTGDLLTIVATVPGDFYQKDFNGFVIADINNQIDAFTNFEALGGGDFTGVDTSFNENTLWVDFGDAGTFRCGDHLSFRINTTPTPPNNTVPQVPLPGALPLMLGGLGFLGFFRARKNS